jgi:hypothetical protein
MEPLSSFVALMKELCCLHSLCLCACASCATRWTLRTALP